MATWDHDKGQWLTPDEWEQQVTNKFPFPLPSEYEAEKNRLYDKFGPVPDWLAERRLRAVNTLAFQAPKRTKAQPLDHAQLRDALKEHFAVTSARELDGLDVWFLETWLLTTGVGYDMILYEHMGTWVCSSVREHKVNS
jgi:hypothetical protein